jgi:serine/threonine-protein kinase
VSNHDPLLGQHLDNFLIQQALGRGGMARVYKGVDTHLKRPVAIKVVEERLRASATYAQRFEREAQAVANLKHPNIVTVFHFGRHENLYYLVMEYIDGADLDAIMRNYESNGELMPHADVIRILEAVGGALDYAHAQGVIHRDVKPSNIMLERSGRSVLADFGLALRVSEGTVGETFGSPHYISPEQARNSANAVPQSDLYSLGVIAYELLAGAVPFDDPNPTTLAMQHIMAAVPSPRAFNRDLSEQIEQVLFRALAKTPEERYPTAAALVAALGQAVDAMKQHPVRVTTADLPPLPPGVPPPPPRRLSMQTALDKVNQELALTNAKGQALTRSPGVDKAGVYRREYGQPGRRTGWLSYVLAGGGALLALAAISILLLNFLRAPASVPTSPTLPAERTPAGTNTAWLALTNQSAVAIVPTNTLLSMSEATLTMPAPTTVAPSRTPSATPSNTAVPTSVPPTSTTAPTRPPTIAPTALPTLPPPTQVIMTQPQPATPAAPTVAYPDGRLFVLIWDDRVFYAANRSGQKVAVSSISIERLLTNGQPAERYAGNRWAGYYPYSEPNKCLILKIQGSYHNLPRTDCPYGYNSEINAQTGEVFWTAADGSIEFRVLWNNSEVGRCEIARQRCEVRFPPA